MARIAVLGGTFAATWLITATAWAQSAQIQGKLVDEQGGALPGAQVSAIDDEKGVIALTNSIGEAQTEKFAGRHGNADTKSLAVANTAQENFTDTSARRIAHCVAKKTS